VLVDVDRHPARAGTPIDPDSARAIPIGVVADAARAQAVDLRPGDILLLRFGWIHDHVHERDDAGRAAAVESLHSPGLAPDHDTAAWLWERRFSVVATDNVAVEAWPGPEDSPFVAEAERAGATPRTSHTGLLHRVLIPLLGMALGELWALDALADACAGGGVYDCLVPAKPLNLTGGAGSAANALAIR
jgi:kynurenine formamidase